MVVSNETKPNEPIRWILVAGNHIRGGEAISFKFSDLNKMVTIAMRLRAFGYRKIRTFPAKLEKQK